MVEINGYAAALAVLATFLMTTMIPLRVLALASNVLFVSYGYFNEILPVLVLHAILFPVNLHRLFQFRRLVRDVRKAESEDIPMASLLPYMKKRTLQAGETLVRKGEQADRMYYLAAGEIEIADIGKKLQPGAIVGEIGVFAANQERTATIVCVTGCVIYELSEDVAKQLFLQDRVFGFSLMRLIINRLLENNGQLVEHEDRHGPSAAVGMSQTA
jgi:CRP-like cAMP-binding protein